MIGTATSAHGARRAGLNDETVALAIVVLEE